MMLPRRHVVRIVFNDCVVLPAWYGIPGMNEKWIVWSRDCIAVTKVAEVC